MKITYYYILLLFFLISCQPNENLVFETVIIKEKTCEDCPQITAQFPKALDDTKLSATINKALEKVIISQINFEETEGLENLDEAIASFNEAFSQLKSMYPQEAMKWEATFDGKVLFEDTNKLTLALDSYLFTGGAHGYNATTFLNFDKRKSKQIEATDLFRDLESFTSYAEEQFRLQQKIPAKTTINSTGFMFENDMFHLPENIGFSEEGIQLYYNQYEVASYADGPILLTLPYQKAKQFLVKRYRP